MELNQAIGSSSSNGDGPTPSNYPKVLSASNSNTLVNTKVPVFRKIAPAPSNYQRVKYSCSKGTKTKKPKNKKLQTRKIKSPKKHTYFDYKIYKTLNSNQRLSEVYLADGFTYIRYCSHDTKTTYLKCFQQKCKGRAVIKNEQLRLTENHNHLRRPEEPMELEFLDDVLKVIHKGCLGAQRAYDIVMQRKPAIRRFVPFDNIIGPLHRIIIKEKQITSAANENIFEFCEFLTERHETYGDIYKKFIIDKEKNTCSIIFVDETVCAETSSAELLIDCSFQANFKNAETYFLNINLKSDSYNGPCFFALMNSFTEEEITKVLTLFRDSISNNMAVLKILSDNNENLISSVTKVYSFAVINCSLFHYILNIFKKLNREGFEFNSKISMQLFNYICAIPLLPPNLIKEALIYIEEESIRFNQNDNFIQVLTYIRQFFIIQITPQMLSNYFQVSWVNEDISNVYKAFYNYLDVESEYEYIQFTDMLIKLQKFFSTSNKENNITGFSSNSFKLKKTLEILWEIKDIKFEEFFKISLPIVTSMLKLLKIWGYSRKKDLDELILFNQSMLDNEDIMVKTLGDLYINQLLFECGIPEFM